MKLNDAIAVIEAVLFAHGDPITLQKLSEATEIEEEEVVKLIDQLERRYNVQESGLRILRLNDGYQLATRQQYGDYVKKALETKRQAPLSQAAMESLSIIAYNQPVTKAFVEQVRGIDSSSVVNTLVERGLLEEAGRLDLPGRPVAYRTTDNFLRCFGLSSLAELPPIPNQEGQLDFDELAELEAEKVEGEIGSDDPTEEEISDEREEQGEE